MIKYTFTCHDDFDGEVTTKEFITESDSWSGNDGPISRFFDFLKGCGFVFAINDQLGIMKESGKFVPCDDDVLAQYAAAAFPTPAPPFVGGLDGLDD